MPTFFFSEIACEAFKFSNLGFLEVYSKLIFEIAKAFSLVMQINHV